MTLAVSDEHTALWTPTVADPRPRVQRTGLPAPRGAVSVAADTAFANPYVVQGMTDEQRLGATVRYAVTVAGQPDRLADIAALSKVAKARGLLLIVDNTFATPFCQQPLSLGADVVMHSATKYLNGHSDIIGGVLVTGDADLATRIKFLQNSVGGVMGPFDAFLANRGLKTLALRMKAHCENALTIARWLETRAGIAKVIYPGLIAHPQHDLAARQMHGGFGGMVTVILDGDLERTKRVLERVQVFTLAESLGGVESLVNHPAIMTHASVPKEVREAGGVTDNLIRLSVGVEDVQDLIADLDQALG